MEEVLQNPASPEKQEEEKRGLRQYLLTFVSCFLIIAVLTAFVYDFDPIPDDEIYSTEDEDNLQPPSPGVSDEYDALPAPTTTGANQTSIKETDLNVTHHPLYGTDDK